MSLNFVDRYLLRHCTVSVECKGLRGHKRILAGPFNTTLWKPVFMVSSRRLTVLFQVLAVG